MNLFHCAVCASTSTPNLRAGGCFLTEKIEKICMSLICALNEYCTHACGSCVKRSAETSSFQRSVTTLLRNEVRRKKSLKPHFPKNEKPYCGNSVFGIFLCELRTALPRPNTIRSNVPLRMFDQTRMELSLFSTLPAVIFDF